MSNPKQALTTAPVGSSLQRRPVQDYHVSVWTSGSRGGGKVPDDLEWRTNPKQYQEEFGTSRGDDIPGVDELGGNG